MGPRRSGPGWGPLPTLGFARSSLDRPMGGQTWEGLETVAHSFPTHSLGEKRKGTLLPRSLPPSPHPGWGLPPKFNPPILGSSVPFEHGSQLEYRDSSPASCASPFGPLHHQLQDRHRLGPRLPLESWGQAVKPSPASEQQLDFSQNLLPFL